MTSRTGLEAIGVGADASAGWVGTNGEAIGVEADASAGPVSTNVEGAGAAFDEEDADCCLGGVSCL